MSGGKGRSKERIPVLHYGGVAEGFEEGFCVVGSGCAELESRGGDYDLVFGRFHDRWWDSGEGGLC